MVSSSGRSNLVEISGEHRRDSPSGKAILWFDGDKEVWLPTALAEVNSDGTVTIPEWLAKEKGLI